MFQNRIARFVAKLDELEKYQVATVGHANAFQEIVGFMPNNCEVHQYR